MFSVLRNRLGIPGLISVIALVFAMGGGAYAANGDGAGDATASAKRGGNVNKLIKRESRKFSKRFSQVFSKRFAIPGPIGPVGFPGLPGADGDDGDDGSDGSDGDDGAPGKSVVTTELGKGGACLEGGTEFEVEGSGESETVCNGNPWTAGGTLPSEATLTGAWSFGMIPSAAYPPAGFTDGIYVNVSFALPLTVALEGGEWKPSEGKEDPGQVHYINAAGEEVFLNEDTFEMVEEEPVNCSGNVSEPKADPGHLCIYEGDLENADSASNVITKLSSPTAGLGKNITVTAEYGASTTGAVANFPSALLTGTKASGWGAWAVTAP